MEWIAKRIREAQAAVPVAAPVAACLEQELAGIIRERALRAAELADLARELIALAETDKNKTMP